MGKEEVLLGLSRTVRPLHTQQQVWALWLCSPRVSGH